MRCIGSYRNYLATSWFAGVTAYCDVVWSFSDFQGVDFTNSQLPHSVMLTGVNFSNAVLTDATIRGCYSDGAVWAAGANFNGATMIRITAAYGNYSAATFVGANLTSAAMYAANLTNANLASANLSGATFQNANLTSANLAGANVAATVFTSTNFTNADLTGATGTPANFASAVWSNTTCPNGIVRSTSCW